MREAIALDDQSPSGLVWKVDRFSGRNMRVKNAEAGDVVGCKDANGYWVFGLNGKRYYAHRAIWLLAYGEWPENYIDHIDGNPSNNKISNLRICPRNNLDNNQNLRLGKANKSGYMGVHWAAKASAWQAQIKVNKKMQWLGYFKTPEAAYNAYLVAKAKLHDFNPIPREK